MSESVVSMPSASPAKVATLGTRARSQETIEFAAANAWIRASRLCHFSIDPLFQAAGVDLSASGVFHIRRDAFGPLMQQCVWRAAPEAHFPLVMGDCFAFDHLPAFDIFLATSPTMRQALPALRWASVALPSLTLWLDESGPQAAVVIDIDLPADPRVVGYFVEGVLVGLYKIVRMAMGDLAKCCHIEVMHDPGPQKFACERILQHPVRVNQARNAVVFDRQLLDLPLPGSVPGLHRKAHELIEQQLPASNNTDTWSEQLERSFRQSPALLGQGIERMATRLALHPRTLQRRLRDEGQLFADIQARCRFDLAATALKSSSCDIESLSDRLGFSDRHSFTRAFKRWTGLAPSEFREQHHLQQKTMETRP